MAAPRIIAVCNTKGGTGKTTVALQLAIARARQGKKVWFVDGDRQQTGALALSLRLEQKGKKEVPFATYVRKLSDQFDTVIIDVGGFDATTMRAAMMLCDLLLIPFQPRSFDSWALPKMHTLLEEVQSMRGEFPAYALLNSADPNSVDNKEAEEALQDYPTMKFLNCPLGRRKAFATSSGYGLGVDELKTRDPKAVKEVKDLVKAVFGDEEEEANAKEQ